MNILFISKDFRRCLRKNRRCFDFRTITFNLFDVGLADNIFTINSEDEIMTNYLDTFQMQIFFVVRLMFKISQIFVFLLKKQEIMVNGAHL